MDGTPKGPYMHPNHAVNKQEFHTSQQQQGQVIKQCMTVEELPEAEGRRERNKSYIPEVRRNLLCVKPAKLNIADFDGVDAVDTEH